MRPTLIRLRSMLRPAALALALLALAAPSVLAYTIFLKDGSKILAKEKYEVVGDKAYIVLPSGTRSAIEFAEIDVARTEEANKGSLGTAMVLEGGQLKQIGQATPAPEKRKTLTDLISERADEPQERAEAPAERAPKPAPRETVARVTGSTAGGNADFRALTRSPLRDVQLTGDLKELFARQGVVEVGIFQGTAANRVFLDVTAGSETSVFRAIAVACAALVNLRGRAAGRLDSIELLLTTPERELGGQFVITPEMAQELIGKQVDVHTFFLQHVKF